MMPAWQLHCDRYIANFQSHLTWYTIIINANSKLFMYSFLQGICKLCHLSCLTCRGPLPSDCFQCTSGYEQQGDICEKKMIWDLLDPDVMKHLAWAIILCIGAIILFSVGFGIMQARERGRLCWVAKHNYVPDWNKGAYNGVSALDPENNHSAEAKRDYPNTAIFKVSSNTHHSSSGYGRGGLGCAQPKL